MESTVLAAVFAILATYFLIVIVWYVVQVIAYWRIFTKAGEAGWKSIIPFYSQYIQYRIAWKAPNMYWIVLGLGIASMFLLSFDNTFTSLLSSLCSLGSFIINVLVLIKLSKAFGHGTGFAVGLILLGPIFMLILGFGQSQYLGPQD